MVGELRHGQGTAKWSGAATWSGATFPLGTLTLVFWRATFKSWKGGSQPCHQRVPLPKRLPSSANSPVCKFLGAEGPWSRPLPPQLGSASYSLLFSNSPNSKQGPRLPQAEFDLLMIP